MVAASKVFLTKQKFDCVNKKCLFTLVTKCFVAPTKNFLLVYFFIYTQKTIWLIEPNYLVFLTKFFGWSEYLVASRKMFLCVYFLRTYGIQVEFAHVVISLIILEPHH